MFVAVAADCCSGKTPEMRIAGEIEQCEASRKHENFQGRRDMRMLAALAINLLFCTALPAHEQCPEAACEEVKQKIRHIQSKMRQGYTREQGEKMQDDLRKLRAIRSKKCR